MPRINYSFTALLDADVGGDNIVAGQAVEIKNQIDGTNPVLYSVETGAGALANPNITDANGVFDFWIDPGIYIISSGSREEIEWLDDGTLLNPTELSVAISSLHIRVDNVITPTERSAGDGGFGASWKVVLASSVVEDAWVIIACTGIATLSLVLLVEGSISAKSIGISETGNHDAAFAAIETNHTGILVDLDGMSVTVTEQEDGNQYYNGAFVLPAETIVLQKSPIASPFSYPNAGIHYCDVQPNTYRGLNVAQFPRSDGLMCFLFREAPGHGNENIGTELISFATKDHGYTILPPVGAGNAGFKYALAYTDPLYDTRNFSSGVMSSDRFGVVAASVLANGTHSDPVFIYSDADGRTWSSDILTGFSSSTWNFHSKIYPHPTVGANAYITYFYSTNIGCLTTTDNGANWTETEDIILSPISEMSVARLADENKWVMIIRSGTNWTYSTSTNMTTWTSPADTGLLCNSNPPELLYDYGQFWLLTYSRTGKNLITNSQNAMVISHVNATDLYDGNASFSDYDLVTELEFFATGYPSTQKLNGRWYALFTSENYGGSTQSTDGLLTHYGPNVGFKKPLAYPGNRLNIGGHFTDKILPTTITDTDAGGIRFQVSPNLTFCRASFAAEWNCEVVTPGVKSESLLRIRRLDADTLLNQMLATVNLTRVDSIALRGKQVSASFFIRPGAGFSAVDGKVAVQFRYSEHTSEQAITSNSGLYSTSDNPLGTTTSKVELVLGQGMRKFTMNPSRLPVTATQLSLRISWTPVGTSSDDYIDLELIKIEQGDVDTAFDLQPEWQELQNARSRVQVFTTRVAGSGSEQVDWPSGPLKAIPTVTTDDVDVTASAITLNGCIMTNANGSNKTVEVTANAVF